MFTGIVQIGGKLRSRTRRGPNYEVDIQAAFERMELGESIAVNGVCLTVTRCLPDGFTADVSLETHERTTLGRVPLGARVNLERALAVGERLGGHFVSGHVDGEGRIVEVTPVGDARRVRLRVPAELMHLIAVKGSLCVDGVSLTVNAVRGTEVELMLIPHTLAITTLMDLRPGQDLNLEVDLLARYVERCLQSGRPSTPNGPIR